MTLGGLCVVRCDQAALQAKASAVKMGRAPFAKETIVIDRATIRNRLLRIASDSPDLLAVIKEEGKV